MGWNAVSGCAFLCLCLMSEPLHKANSICKAKISQKCAMRSRKNSHDFTVFGVVSTPYLPNAWDRGFFRPRVILWHRVLTIGAKMEGILVSHQSTFPCKSKTARERSVSSFFLHGRLFRFLEKYPFVVRCEIACITAYVAYLPGDSSSHCKCMAWARQAVSIKRAPCVGHQGKGKLCHR